MLTKPLVAASLIVVALALAFGILEIRHIGSVFEEKSALSYALKTGDLDPHSAGALDHVRGAAAYGKLMAIRAALAFLLGGALIGFLAGHLRQRQAPPRAV